MHTRTKQRNGGRWGRRRASGLSLMVVLAVVITGLIMTLAWASSMESSAAATRTQSDEAQLAADGAVNWAVVMLRNNPSWRPAAGTSVTVNGWTCAVSCTDMGATIGMAVGVLGNPLRFTALAIKPGVAGSATVSANAQGILAYAPQFWSGGNMSIAESATIKGDVETMGTLTLNPPTTGGTLANGATGSWKAKGAVTDNNPGANGSQKYFSSTPAGNVLVLTAPTSKAINVYTNLMAGPYVDLMSCLVIDGTGHYVIDFSKAGGKPVHFSGSASYIGNVGVKSSSTPGNDTLIIDGDATFTGSYPYNLAYAPLNMVVHGNCSFNGSGSPGVAIHGSFYVTGNWTQTGTYDFAGTVITDGKTTLGGTGTVATGSPPTYDPRYVPKVTGFIGNLP